jgi:hypothetical protein
VTDRMSIAMALIVNIALAAAAFLGVLSIARWAITSEQVTT